MRDFYSLVKCVANDAENEEEQERLFKAIERNFGGLPKQLDEVMSLFFSGFIKKLRLVFTL